MNKKHFIGSSILYKRPISKTNSSYNSIIPNSTTNKQTISFNFSEEEQFSNTNKNISSVRTNANTNIIKKDSNLNTFKKININYPHCNSSRYSVNNIINKNKLKKNINKNNNNNNSTLYFHEKENTTEKIYQNYNNNTCNISLNQHFYNIDYNNFANSNSNLKNINLELNTGKNKKYININQNKEYNDTNNSKKKYSSFYLNTLTNSVPIYFNKKINNTHEDLSNHAEIFLSNIIPKKNKKINKINLIKVNSKNKILNMSKNISNLNNYTNFVKILSHRKNINNNNNIHKNKSSSINSFKYKKKIITYNSFIKKKEENDSFNLQNEKNSIPNQAAFFNRTEERMKDNNIKTIRRTIKINNENNSFILKKIDTLNRKKPLNLNNLNEHNNKVGTNFHTTKNININKKIKYSLNQKYINKQNDFEFSLDKNKGSASLPFIEYSFNNNKIKKNKKYFNINMNYKNNTLNNDSIEKFSNNSLIRLNNMNINNTFKKDNSSIETNEKYNTNKNENHENIGYEKKHVMTLNNKTQFKNIKSEKENRVKSNMPILLNKDHSELSNLKKSFLNHYSTENTNAINNTNKEMTLQQKVKLNKNKINLKKKQSNENSILINSSLTELLNKFRQAKNKFKINKFNDKKSITKKDILNKQYNYIINQSNSLYNLKNNLNDEKIKGNTNKNKKEKNTKTNSSEDSTRSKENNEFMEQSIKLSQYIKNYYLTNFNYPQTNLNFYRIGRIIGQGGFAKVNLGLNVLTGRVVAIKSFNKTIKTKYGDNLNMDKILYEINLMRKLNHPNITKILETFEDDKFYFIIMEYINGGNLFSYVKKRRKLSEKISKFLFKQIILAIKHIHSQLIVHRDIKLENILIDMNNKVKICDFGIGIILSSEDQDLHSHCGTPMYIAPEIILSNKENGYKGFPVDIWSAGIALYIMLSGKLPFNLDEEQDDIEGYNNHKKEKNIKLKYEIVHKEPKYIENISDEARNLLKGLLNKNPKKRLTCEQILNHPWLSDINNNKNHLFSKAEKDILFKSYIDYRKSKQEDLVENFTLSNLFNDKKNSDKDFNNIETKSSLLAPFNSLNYEYFNINDDIHKNKVDYYDDFYNKNLFVEKDLLSFGNKAKELNYQYELNNNKEVDNGVLINSKSMACSSSSSFSNTSTFRNNDIDYNYNKIDYINEEKLECILNQMELMGYDREYIIKSVKNNYLNHVSTVFFLLMHYENI